MPICKRCDGDGCWVCYSSGFTGSHTEAKDRIRVLAKRLREVKITDWVSRQKFNLLREQIEVAKQDLADYEAAEEEKLDSNQSYDHFHDDPDDQCG